ncbi:MAG: hypothetical protein B6U97_01095 [Candidatus Altiarchaeales archaeon ex4484_96]|nr:MAG: hypothetical protein B6U97_01095 [Candidatus Altiarchaeales archaeon ex4484_96]
MSDKILHVEDDLDTREFVALLLKKEGFNISSVGDGESCMEKIDEGFDLILLDIMLPDMSGWDIFQKINKRDMKKKPKVIFISVIPISDERLEILKKEGVSDYITKPFDNNDLINRIKKALT